MLKKSKNIRHTDIKIRAIFSNIYSFCAQFPIVHCFHRAKKEATFSIAIGISNSCKSAFPNTRAWEQQERNKIKKQMKKVREA